MKTWPCFLQGCFDVAESLSPSMRRILQDVLTGWLGAELPFLRQLPTLTRAALQLWTMILMRTARVPIASAHNPTPRLSDKGARESD